MMEVKRKRKPGGGRKPKFEQPATHKISFLLPENYYQGMMEDIQNRGGTISDYVQGLVMAAQKNLISYEPFNYPAKPKEAADEPAKKAT